MIFLSQYSQLYALSWMPGIRIFLTIQSLGYKHESSVVFIWTNVILLSIGPLGRKCIEFLTQLNNFHSWKCIWKCRLLLRRSLFPTCLCPKKEGKDKSMMTSSNGNIFRVTSPLCGEFTGPGEFPAQRPMKRIFDVSLICAWESLWSQCNESVY